MHPRQVATGVAFGQLGIQGRLEIATETLGNGLHLYRDATGGIDHRAIKQVQQDVDALRVTHHGQVAIHRPCRIGEHLPEQSLVKQEARTGLLEVAHAIPAIDYPVEHLHAKEQQGVNHQLVVRHYPQEINYHELQQRIHDADVGKGSHPFMGDNGGVVGHADYAQHGREHRELVDPKRGIHPVGRYPQLFQDKPQANGLSQQQHHSRQEEVNGKDVAKSASHLPHVSLAQAEGDIAGGSTAHGIGQEAQQGNHAAYHVVHAIVCHAQDMQHHAAGVKADGHGEQHADIEQQRVLGYAPVLGIHIGSIISSRGHAICRGKHLPPQTRSYSKNTTLS